MLGPAPQVVQQVGASAVECKVIPALYEAGPFYINGECVRYQGIL